MRVLIVINAASGGSDAGIYDLARQLGAAGAEVVLRFTTEERRIESLVSDAEAFDRIVAAGGDGTVSCVCYATRFSRVPVLVYPAGTANLVASNLGLPTDPPALARILLEGATIAVDLGELERSSPGAPGGCSGFAVMAGAGYDAAIMEAAQPLKASLGAAAYLVAAVANLTPAAAHFELDLDGTKISTDGIAVLVVNFGRIQFDLPVTHGSDPTDGLFEVAVIRSRNVVGLLPAVAAAMMDLVGDFPDRGPSLDVYSASRVEVSAYPPLRMQYDGEVLDALTPFAARVLPGAATLLVAADSPLALRERSGGA